MGKLALLIGTAVLAVCMASASSWASLPGNTAYVDPESGTDSATCGGQSLADPSTGPCATLNQALANITSGGNIFIQKGGVFGPVFLSGQVSIAGPEDRSAVITWTASTLPGCIGGAPGTCNGSANAVNAVDVEAGASNTVKLKNIIVNGGSSTNPALHVGTAFNMSMTQVTLRGGSGTIPEMMLVDSSQGSQLQLYMKKCDVGFSSTGGAILIAPSGSTPVSVTILHSEVHNALFGVKADATGLTAPNNIQIGIDGSGFAYFNNAAVTAKTLASPGGGGAHFALARSIVGFGAGQGLNINGSNAVATLFEDVITNNNIGVAISNGGTVFGFGNSEIFANGINVAGGSITPQPLQ
jgi:hypothetical protein